MDGRAESTILDKEKLLWAYHSLVEDENDVGARDRVESVTKEA